MFDIFYIYSIYVRYIVLQVHKIIKYIPYLYMITKYQLFYGIYCIHICGIYSINMIIYYVTYNIKIYTISVCDNTISVILG